MPEGRLQYSSDEMMTVAAARQLRNRMVCFVGIGLPSAAANLARATHAPDCVLIYESGAIGAKPTRLPLSIGDGELAETADAVVSLPEIFNYWLQGGRVDIGFLGAAQVDRHCRMPRPGEQRQQVDEVFLAAGVAGHQQHGRCAAGAG